MAKIDPMAAPPLEAPVVDTSQDRRFFGHPRGLSTLFFTEMWERFSYYGMRALLILFMTASVADGGMGYGVARAGAVYGLYTAMVYLMGVPGGWVADKVLGLRKSVLWGGVLIAMGHFTMAFPSQDAFFIGLVLIVLGTGLLKPNISALVGTLYRPGDNRRDAGFSIYYMGINLGAFIAPLACGYVGQRIDWHWGFGLAGLGMTAGLIQYLLGQRHLGSGGIRPAEGTLEEVAGWRRQSVLYSIGLLVLIGAAAAAMMTGLVKLTPETIANAFGVVLFLTVIGIFAWIFLGGEWTREERDRLIVIFVLFCCASLFWGSFEQAGSTLNLFADRDTDNNVFGFAVPASWYQSLNAIFILMLAPVFAWLWVRLGPKEPSLPIKFALGLFGVGAGFVWLAVGAAMAAEGVKVSPMWLVVTYLLHTTGELCLSPVGLSAMTKLAPVRVTGMMMGVWFLGSAVGNFIGGRMAGLYESMPLDRLFFYSSLMGLISAGVMVLLAPKIKRLIGTAR